MRPNTLAMLVLLGLPVSALADGTGYAPPRPAGSVAVYRGASANLPSPVAVYRGSAVRPGCLPPQKPAATRSAERRVGEECV